MARITFQVLEGFERGRIFGDLVTPVTIGREEDNTIQLNDERVSRFHDDQVNDDYDVQLRLTQGTRNDNRAIEKLYLPRKNGESVRLSTGLVISACRRALGATPSFWPSERASTMAEI